MGSRADLFIFSTLSELEVKIVHFSGFVLVAIWVSCRVHREPCGCDCYDILRIFRLKQFLLNTFNSAKFNHQISKPSQIRQIIRGCTWAAKVFKSTFPWCWVSSNSEIFLLGFTFSFCRLYVFSCEILIFMFIIILEINSSIFFEKKPFKFVCHFSISKWLTLTYSRHVPFGSSVGQKHAGLVPEIWNNQLPFNLSGIISFWQFTHTLWQHPVF